MGTVSSQSFARVQSDSDSDNVDTNNNIDPNENGESNDNIVYEERRRRRMDVDFGRRQSPPPLPLQTNENMRMRMHDARSGGTEALLASVMRSSRNIQQWQLRLPLERAFEEEEGGGGGEEEEEEEEEEEPNNEPNNETNNQNKNNNERKDWSNAVSHEELDRALSAKGVPKMLVRLPDEAIMVTAKMRDANDAGLAGSGYSGCNGRGASICRRLCRERRVLDGADEAQHSVCTF